MFEGVLMFGALNIVCELILLALIPPKIKLRLLGNYRAMVAFHIVVGGFTLYVHWGTVTGTGSAMVAFIASWPALWVAKQMIFGYVTNEPCKVTDRDSTFANSLTDEDRKKYNRLILTNKRFEFDVIAPVFHRRIIGYKVSELN